MAAADFRPHKDIDNFFLKLKLAKVSNHHLIIADDLHHNLHGEDQGLNYFEKKRGGEIFHLMNQSPKNDQHHNEYLILIP